MAAKLYAVPASHPSAVAERALQLKGVDYERIDLVPVFHKLHQKVRFGGKGTVPGVIFDDGRKVLGSRAIVRALETMRPEPALIPTDPSTLARVEEAETWGDEVLQPLVRRVTWLALSRNTGAQLSYSEGSKLFPPTPKVVAKASGGLLGFAERKLNAASDDAVRADLAALDSHLDRIDAWLADGTLGGEQPTVADLQVASGLRLLLTLGDIAPRIESRPAGAFARRVFPEYPGHVPAGALVSV